MNVKFASNVSKKVTETGRKIKTLRTDNGLDYYGKAFEKILEEN